MEDAVLSLLPPAFRKTVAQALNAETSRVEEIRCRLGQPVSVVECGKLRLLPTDSISQEHLDGLFERAVNVSVHAHSEEIQNGFLFTDTGYRIGLCGTAYISRDGKTGIRELTSVSIRIPREIPGCSDKIFPMLIENGFRSTLILSPPGYGKTTLLRELIRKLSLSGLRVAVADERGEIAAGGNRRMGFDLGPNTDVMKGGRKAESAMMLIRAMNPQILAFDEITCSADLNAITLAAGCGAELLATAHAADSSSLHMRSAYRKLLKTGIFQRAVWIRLCDQKRNLVVEELNP